MMRRGYEVIPLTFIYRGIARKEIEAARKIAKIANVNEHRFVRLPDLREAGEIGIEFFPNLPATYIPMRNSVFYSFAASLAEEKDASCIVGGHINGDDLVFKDATPSFFRILQKLVWEGSEKLSSRRTRIIRPLSKMRKYEVVRKAVKLGVPLEHTWSCHKDVKKHCWECDGCLSRIEAFTTAGIEDPIRK